MNFRPHAALAVVLLCCAQPALAADGELALRVHLNPEHELFNRPLVTVSVCSPQAEGAARSCIEVPNVLVDTGSTGLLLRRTALKGLGGLKPAGAGGYAYCGRYQNNVIWGHIAQAWVGLGDRHTESPIAIALFDLMPDDRAEGCAPRETNLPYAINVVPPGINGVLGVSTIPATCAKYPGGACPTADDEARYYRRGAGDEASLGASAWHGVQPPPEYELSNPVAALPPTFNDGVTLRVDAPDSAALKSGVSSGTLYLGTGRWREQLFAAGTKRIPLVHMSLARVAIVPEHSAPHLAQALLDSGNCWNFLPASFLPHATDAYASSLQPMKLFFAALDASGPFAKDGPYRVAIADADSAAIEPDDQHGVATSFRDSKRLLLGMPFFYGRTIAFGLAGDPRQASGHAPDPGYLMIAPGAQDG